METIDAILTRRSVRRFKPDPIPHPVVEQALAAAAHAPSAKNSQNWLFIVLEGEHKQAFTDVMAAALAALPEAMPQGSAPNSLRIMRQAPLVVVVYDTSEAPVRIARAEADDGGDFVQRAKAAGLEYVIAGIDVQSVAAAIQNMLLAAHASGLGGLWICDIVFAYRQIAEHLRPLAGDAQLLAAVALGYPEEGFLPPAVDRDWRKVTRWPGRGLF